jgi:hypothetical protein
LRCSQHSEAHHKRQRRDVFQRNPSIRDVAETSQMRKQQSFADHPKRPFSSPHNLEVVSLVLSITRQKRDDLFVALDVSTVPQGPSLNAGVRKAGALRKKKIGAARINGSCGAFNARAAGRVTIWVFLPMDKQLLRLEVTDVMRPSRRLAQ